MLYGRKNNLNKTKKVGDYSSFQIASGGKKEIFVRRKEGNFCGIESIPPAPEKQGMPAFAN
jgi:hypothetical protein